jgi:hypothetical protein
LHHRFAVNLYAVKLLLLFYYTQPQIQKVQMSVGRLALTLLFAEKKNLPTAEEVEKLRFEERFKPLNLSASGPKGIKKGKESKN